MADIKIALGTWNVGYIIIDLDCYFMLVIKLTSSYVTALMNTATIMTSTSKDLLTRFSVADPDDVTLSSAAWHPDVVSITA